MLEPPAVDYHFPTLAENEAAHIDLAMHLVGGNVSKAADLLGIRRQSLQRKLRANPKLWG